MDKTGFWSGVGHWFKGSRQTIAAEHDQVLGESSQEIDVRDADAPDTDTAALPAKESTAVSKFGLSRSQPGLERLEGEYRRVVGLVDAIQTHLESQAENTERMANSLDRLVENLQAAPEAMKVQSELLLNIRDDLSSEVACAKRVEEGISQLPHIADAQRETMVSIAHQLDLSREVSERTNTTMSGFQEAMGDLGEAASASTKTLQKMRWDTSARDEQIARLLEEQTKRFTQATRAAVAMAVIAAAVGVFALLR